MADFSRITIQRISVDLFGGHIHAICCRKSFWYFVAYSNGRIFRSGIRLDYRTIMVEHDCCHRILCVFVSRHSMVEQHYARDNVQAVRCLGRYCNHCRVAGSVEGPTTHKAERRIDFRAPDNTAFSHPNPRVRGAGCKHIIHDDFERAVQNVAFWEFTARLSMKPDVAAGISARG